MESDVTSATKHIENVINANVDKRLTLRKYNNPTYIINAIFCEDGLMDQRATKIHLCLLLNGF